MSDNNHEEKIVLYCPRCGCMGGSDPCKEAVRIPELIALQARAGFICRLIMHFEWVKPRRRLDVKMLAYYVAREDLGGDPMEQFALADHVLSIFTEE